MSEWESASKQKEASKEPSPTINLFPPRLDQLFLPSNNVHSQLSLASSPPLSSSCRCWEARTGKGMSERRKSRDGIGFFLSLILFTLSLTRSPCLISAVRASMCLTVAVLKSLPHLDIPSINISPLSPLIYLTTIYVHSSYPLGAGAVHNLANQPPPVCPKGSGNGKKWHHPQIPPNNLPFHIRHQHIHTHTHGRMIIIRPPVHPSPNPNPFNVYPIPFPYLV